MDLNQCTFVGRFTADPKLTESTNPDETKCNFTLAVNREFEKGKADYPHFVVWGDKKALAVVEHCQKGKEVTVLARYHTEWYPPTKAGGKGINFQIFQANRVIFGIDSQKVLEEKEKIWAAEMNEVVTLEDSKTKIYKDVDAFLTEWSKERYDI